MDRRGRNQKGSAAAQADVDAACGADALIVTLPVSASPPVTEAGVKVRDVTRIGLTVRLLDLVTPRNVAEMTAVEAAGTGFVRMLNEGDAVAPPGTVMVGAAGFAMLPFDVATCTTAPAAGAGPLSVTFPVDAAGPITAVGETVSVTRAGGFNVMVAELPLVNPLLVLVVPVTEIR